jgi:hypothetical protein
LLWRGYRVCLSTHSPHVLDVVWALQVLRSHGGAEEDVLDLFNLRPDSSTKSLARTALSKDMQVHYFQRNGTVVDISTLDPGAEDGTIAGWGGLSEFSGHVGDIVARVVARSQQEAQP